jgi:hypothetical protein
MTSSKVYVVSYTYYCEPEIRGYFLTEEEAKVYVKRSIFYDYEEADLMKLEGSDSDGEL